MTTIHVPRTTELLTLAQPWTFSLRGVPSNSAAWVGFGLHLKHPDIMNGYPDIAPEKARRIDYRYSYSKRSQAPVERVTLPEGVRLFVLGMSMRSWWKGLTGPGEHDEVRLWLRKQDNYGRWPWAGRLRVPIADLNGMEIE